jgi:hypothetical protein
MLAHVHQLHIMLTEKVPLIEDLHSLSPKIQAKAHLSFSLSLDLIFIAQLLSENKGIGRLVSNEDLISKSSSSRNPRDGYLIVSIDFSERFLISLWSPLAKNSPKKSTGFRVYLKNILRRSHTTYHTLIAAFYYLALLRFTIQQKFSIEPFEVPKELQPLQCRRRMFLTALILGWKFTQDYGYSTRRWASFSGLSEKELNKNEGLFLSVIDWRLFISHTTFSHWKSEVLYYVQNPDVALPEFTSFQ